MVDEKKRDSSEASTVSFISRKKRKEDGKLRKRQSIEESGGIRPRNPHEISAGTRNQNDNADVQGDDRMQQHSKTSTSSSNAYPEQSQPKAFSSKSSPARGLNDNRGKKFDRNTEGGSGIRRHRFGRVMDIVPCRNKPRFSTISIAIPGSVVANCQTRELKTQICGQIARAATIYHVDEIIVYDDNLSSSINKSSGYGNRRRNGSSDGKNVDRNTNVDTPDDGDNKPIKDDTNDNISISRERASSDPHSFMARVLQYCECPQYLRRNFFPMHPDLQFAGLLPPIDPPHHVRAEDHCKYREGVVLEDKYVAKMENSKNKDSLVGRLVNCGIRGRPVLIDQRLQPGIRCTVQIDLDSYKPSSGRNIIGKVVSPSAPREENGTYWGYSVRLAASLKEALDTCPFEQERYDLKIGTSERGNVNVDSPSFLSQLSSAFTIASNTKSNKKKKQSNDKSNKTFRHALIVFGGVAGIEECVDADETLKLPGSDSHKLFDLWINICPYQGSKTIRTEEAVMIALAKINPLLASCAATTESGNDGDGDDDKVQQSNNGDVEGCTEHEGNPRSHVSTNLNTKKVPDVTFSDDEPSEESSSDEDDADDDNNEEDSVQKKH